MKVYAIYKKDGTIDCDPEPMVFRSMIEARGVLQEMEAQGIADGHTAGQIMGTKTAVAHGEEYSIEAYMDTVVFSDCAVEITPSDDLIVWYENGFSQTIANATEEDIIAVLSGASPVAERWEDGNGNSVCPENADRYTVCIQKTGLAERRVFPTKDEAIAFAWQVWELMDFVERQKLRDFEDEFGVFIDLNGETFFDLAEEVQ